MSNTVKKSTFSYVFLLKILCVAFMAAFLICQFLPFWTSVTYDEENYKNHIIHGEELIPIETDISLAQYVWFAEDYPDLFGEFDEGMENFDGEPLNQNDVAAMPFLCTLLSIFGAVFLLLKRETKWAGLFPLVSGAYAVKMYLTDPANVYKIGYSYNIQLAMSFCVLAFGLAITALWVVEIVKWFTVKKRHY